MAASFAARIARQALLEWAASRRPFDRILAETLREHRVGSNVRSIAADLAFECLRYWPVAVPQPVALGQADWVRGLDETLEAYAEKSPRGWGLKRHLKAKPTFETDAVGHLVRIHGMPAWMATEVGGERAAPWHEILHAQLNEAPVTVRFNESRVKREEFLAKYPVTPARFVPGAYVFDQRFAASADPGFKDGWFEIQDEHSQVVAFVAAPKPNETVLDLCAGSGGKTLHLAELMQGQGEIVAHDSSARKLALLQTRARRNGRTNIRISEALPPADRKFDVVLVDAPCSGLGTLRRGPERLYGFSQKEAAQLARVQSELFRLALDRVKPGGRIVYATCTVRPAENTAIVAAALKDGRARAGDLRAVLKNAWGTRADDFLAAADASPARRLAGDGAEVAPAAWLALAPSQTSGALTGDGFFVALVNC